jgi:hypothetical protein
LSPPSNIAANNAHDHSLHFFLLRAEETSWVAMKEGLVSGVIALIPAGGALALAMRNPKFVRVRLKDVPDHVPFTARLIHNTYHLFSFLGYKLAESYCLGNHASTLCLWIHVGE